jgi:hypothetical protein
MDKSYKMKFRSHVTNKCIIKGCSKWRKAGNKCVKCSGWTKCKKCNSYTKEQYCNKHVKSESSLSNMQIDLYCNELINTDLSDNNSDVSSDDNFEKQIMIMELNTPTNCISINHIDYLS